MSLVQTRDAAGVPAGLADEDRVADDVRDPLSVGRPGCRDHRPAPAGRDLRRLGPAAGRRADDAAALEEEDPASVGRPAGMGLDLVGVVRKRDLPAAGYRADEDPHVEWRAAGVGHGLAVRRDGRQHLA